MNHKLPTLDVDPDCDPDCDADRECMQRDMAALKTRIAELDATVKAQRELIDALVLLVQAQGGYMTPEQQGVYFAARKHVGRWP